MQFAYHRWDDNQTLSIPTFARILTAQTDKRDKKNKKLVQALLKAKDVRYPVRKTVRQLAGWCVPRDCGTNIVCKCGFGFWHALTQLSSNVCTGISKR